MPDFALETAAGGVVAGIDEAGRGPWAGPVVAAAVVLEAQRLPAALAGGLDDSKKLTPARRADLRAALSDLAGAGAARIGIGQATVAEIDRLNVLAATMVAMGRAVGALGMVPDHALVDGNRAPDLPCPVTCVVRGDATSLSIAAASIVAKESRDRLMANLAERHPGYGWERNAGYGTAEHRAALERLGATSQHRRSFRPVLKILGEGADEAPYLGTRRLP
jgi:ribonuclease HII